MNWLKRRLRNWVNNNGDNDVMQMTSNKLSRKGHVISQDSPGEILSTEPLRLSIYSANGGVVIETRQYDRVKDRSINQLYVVGHGEDIADTVSKVITMESLRG
jgi:hypothetical protein